MKNQKHAYLILAHTDFYILETLLKLLDDERNDIYIHFDEKCALIDENSFKGIVHNTQITFVKRHTVTWAQYSVCEAELELFRAAYEKRTYSYYHLISGVDLPLKTQDQIHHFFDTNYGYEFITCASTQLIKTKHIKDRFNKYYYYDDAPVSEKIKFNAVNHSPVGRYLFNYKISFGSQWVSVTGDFVGYLLSKENWIKQHFSYTHACDEVYKQCVVMNSPYRQKLWLISDKRLVSHNMRMIDWSQGDVHPRVFVSSDYDQLMRSEMLFARKFDTSVDKKIVDRIYDTLK